MEDMRELQARLSVTNCDEVDNFVANLQPGTPTAALGPDRVRLAEDGGAVIVLASDRTSRGHYRFESELQLVRR